MLRTLRRRLITSHHVPLLISVPLLGIVLIYVLGNQVVRDQATRQLDIQAQVISTLARERLAIWSDPAQAYDFTSRMSAVLGIDVTLLGSDGHIVASGYAEGGPMADGLDRGPSAAQVVESIPVVRTEYSQSLHADVTELIVPVRGPDQRVLGAVQVTDDLSDDFAPYQRLRVVTLAFLLAGIALSAGLDRALTLEVNRVPAYDDTRRHVLANTIHELGRPLGALLSAVQALQNGADDDRAFRRELLSGMDDELRRLSRLLGDLKQLDRQPTLLPAVHCRPVEMSTWLLATMVPRRELARAKGIHWVADIPAKLPAIHADPDRIGQALGNLMHNAIKYTPPGGTITIAAGTGGTNLWVRVSDTGPGMSSGERDRVFEAFYRGSTVSPNTPGMGLGLTITRDIISAHGGRLDLETTPRAGTTFTVWLPIHDDAGNCH
jgi:signal transduction histidine kinase